MTDVVAVRDHPLLGASLEDWPTIYSYDPQGLQIVDAQLVAAQNLFRTGLRLGLDPDRPIVVWYLKDASYGCDPHSDWWQLINLWLDQWHRDQRIAVVMDLRANLPGWYVIARDHCIARARDYEVPRADLSLDRSGWLCLNRAPRTARMACLALLADRGLLDSATWTLREWPSNEFMPDRDLISELVGIDVGAWLDSLRPRRLDHDSDPLMLDRQSWRLWDQHLLAVITETSALGPGLMITEKIYRALAYGLPIIPWANHGTLAYLENLGFKTWGHIWDQSWDQIESDTLRLDQMISELQAFLSRPLREQQQLIRSCQHIVDHNREILALQPTLNQIIVGIIDEIKILNRG